MVIAKIKRKLKIAPKLSTHCFGTIISSNESKLFNGDECLRIACEVVDNQSAHRLGEQLHVFPNKSYSILIALAESHVSIHTWPERKTVQLDVFLCNYNHDNTKRCEAIFDQLTAFFEPQEVDKSVLHRL